MEPAPWGFTSTSWLERGKAGRWQASHWCGSVCPGSVCAAWLRRWRGRRTELPGSVPARSWLRRGIARTFCMEKSGMLKGKRHFSHPFELPVLVCSLLLYCCVSAWLDGDFACRGQGVAGLREEAWLGWAACRQRGLRPKAPAACPRLPSPSTSSSVHPWGMPGPSSKPWLSHVRAGMSRTKSNIHEICAKILLTFNRSWAVPRRCKSEFLSL